MCDYFDEQLIDVLNSDRNRKLESTLSNHASARLYPCYNKDT